MNILLLVPVYPDDLNKYRGNFMREQALALALKHNVLVICSIVDKSKFSVLPSYSIHSRIDSQNLEEVYIKIHRSFPVLTILFYLAMSVILVLRILRNRNIDIIHGHFTWPMAFLSFLISRYKKIPYCVTENSSNFLGQFRSWAHKKLGIFSLKKADAVFAVGDFLSDDVRRNIHREVKILHNTVDFKKFNIGNDYPLDGNATNEHDKPVNHIWNVGFLGVLEDNRKGLDLLIMALSGLDDFTLHIGGDGKGVPSFKQMAQEYGMYDKCIFYGGIKPDEVPRFLAKLDVFVLPSRAEGFVVVIIEALAAGIPVITTRLGGSDVLVNDDSGIVITNESLEELKQAIVDIRRKKFDPNKIKECAYQCSYEAFSDTATTYYKDILSNKVTK